MQNGVQCKNGTIIAPCAHDALSLRPRYYTSSFQLDANVYEQ